MSQNYEWTNHSVRKMRYYRLTESRVKRVVRYPKRKEEGIALGTVAVMQPAKLTRDKKRPWREEIWVMYRELSSKSQIPNYKRKKRIISAWRYPGVSPKGKEIPIPQDIREELEKGLE